VRDHAPLWFWCVIWGVLLLAGLGILGLYAWLPADGATGALESFSGKGFRVQWLLEDRPAGLQAGDLILRAGGHTADEWLAGTPPGPEWRTGGIVPYETLRDGVTIVLPIRLAPIPLRAILARWGTQLLVSLALLILGAYVLRKRPAELAARLLMLFCVAVAVQLWCDAYNFQFGVVPWSWAFWFHLCLEHLTFTLSYASICHFALVFPRVHPLLERFPRGLPWALYLSNPLLIALVMLLSPTASRALAAGNQASLFVVLLQVGLALAAGIRSLRTARDPVSQAQMRWILSGVGLAFAVAIPGYIVPLALLGRPLIPHPLVMLLTILIPCLYGVAILRYRLFDIQIIVNQTLVYATLTTLLAGLYLLLVRGLTLFVQEILHRQDDTAVVFIATLGIALAFDPLRRRVQTLIDRTFYRARLDYQQLLPEMSERLATSIVLDDLAALLIAELPQRLQIAYATLAVLDPEGERLVPASGDHEHPALPVGHPLIAHLRHQGHPVLRLQPPAGLPREARDFLDRHGVELSIPLIVGTQQVGLYNLGPKRSGKPYGRGEVRLLYLLGQQAAVAVENSRLFQAEREQRRLAEALQEAADAVSSTLDLDRVLDHILEQVETVVAGDACNVMLVDGGTARVVRCRGYEELGVAERIASLPLAIADYPTLSRMMATGRPTAIADTAADPDWVQLEGWQWLRSYVSAPIQVAGRTVGFLNVDRTEPAQFGAADARRLEAFARHAATALENARLYDQAQQEISDRKRAEVRIQASLEEKDVLLKEIHHRVKNNLQVISSLLYVQSQQAEDQDTLRMFQESQHRIRSMALVHERLYQAEDLARVNFSEYVRSLARFLLRAYGVTPDLVKLDIHMGDLSLGIDAAIPCGLIINELVSNSLKHAFPPGQAGQIRIELDVDPAGDCLLVVGDDGIGLPAGLDVRNGSSLGLRLVNTLVRQLQGTLQLDRRGGTTFRLRFPRV
jgi:two-component sensor histidine kinase